MHIHSNVLDDINLDVRKMLEDAAAAHIETGRRATVTLKLTIRKNKEAQKREVVGRVTATIPEGSDDSRTRKADQCVLVSVTDEHPGQQRIDGA